MSEDEIKQAAARVFEALFKDVAYEARTLDYAEAASCLTKVFRHHYTELIEKAIRGTE
jgi:hypothetical protein